MGIKKIRERRPSLTIDKVIRAYELFKSTRAAGEVLGVSYQTVRRYLKSVNYPIKPPGGGYRKGNKYPGYHRGCLAEWLREHPGKPLPKKPRDIVKLTGCSIDAVKCYIYRRKKSISDDSSGPS